MANDNLNRDNPDRRYRISLVDGVSHERLWSVGFRRTQFIIAAVSFVLLLLVGFFCLIAFTPIRSFIPGYPDAISKRQAIQNAMRIDSLETRILQWELYSENLRKVVSGEDPIRLDSLILRQEAENAARKADSAYLAFRDSSLRALVSEAEQFEVTGPSRSLPIEAVFFYTPVKGVISEGFSPAHPYVDITAPAGTVVTAILDGTVVYTGWEEDKGYTLVIQHADDILSVYSDNQKLLRKSGDRVRAGAPVALVGNSGSLETGDHLHLELWYKGESVNPNDYINF